MSEINEYTVVRDRLTQKQDNRSAQVCMRYLDGSIERPALLAALLEDAGAQRIRIKVADYFLEVGKSGDMWWIPVPEGA